MRIGPIELPDFPLLLAPMEDVSDPPFRAICKEAGADLLYTEFISSEGLIRKAIKYLNLTFHECIIHGNGGGYGFHDPPRPLPVKYFIIGA